MGLFRLSQQADSLGCAESIKLSFTSERQWVGRSKAVSYRSSQPQEEQDWWLALTAKINPRQGAKHYPTRMTCVWYPCPKGRLRSHISCWAVGRRLRFFSCHTSPVGRVFEQVTFCLCLLVLSCKKQPRSQLWFQAGRHPTWSGERLGRNW